jgi:membrane associated rhomboid family serine protease
MSESLPIATLLTIVATVVVSLKAFRDSALTEKLIFEPRPILAYREYHRLLSSGLLHLDANHLIWNMLTLFLFGRGVEAAYGAPVFLVIYIGSIAGGSALSLWLHRHHEYRALGASGGVCGILFAWILLFPGGAIFLFFIPIGIPGWAYAIGYLAYSFIAMKHGWGNVGHDAHIGGAVAGLLLAAAIEPRAVAQSPWMFATLMGAGGLMVLYLWKNPLMLPLKIVFSEWRGRSGARPRRPLRPKEDEVNVVLEKVSRSGIQSLSAKERRILERAARK